jgi:hypothetical protein
MSGVDQASDERLLTAHRALRDSGDLQFDMAPAPGPPAPPAWLKALGEWIEQMLKPVGRFFSWIGGMIPDAPYAKIFLWGLGILLALLLIWIVQDRIRHGVWRWPRFRRRRAAAAEGSEEQAWQPEAATARAWLQEADALAAEGHYAAAVHHLLLRSVEDLTRRRPQIVRPALTSRDLARMDSIPAAPRRLFADIAAVVERSLFGGRAVDAGQWASCRAAYADFAQARAWKA